MQIVKETIHPDNGGLRALYRGIAPNLIGILPEKSIKLAGNDFFRSFYGKKFVKPDANGQIQLPLWVEVLRLVL